MKKSTVKVSVLVLAVLLGLYAGMRFLTKIEPDQKKVVVLYGENSVKYPEVRASLLGMDVTGKIITEDNIDYSVLGEYQIRYLYRLFGILPLAEKHVQVNIVDMDSPEIGLPNGNVVFARSAEEDVFPAYTVTDNYDDEEHIRVSMDTEVTRTSDSVFESSLVACDSSENCTYKSLRVYVGDISEEEFEPGVFDLFRYDHAGTILRQDGNLLSEAEFGQIYFIGDSNFMNMSEYRWLNPSRVIARYALGPSSFDFPANYNNTPMSRSAAGLVHDLQPGMIVLHMGLSEAGNGDPVLLAQMYGDKLDELQEAAPDASIFVSAITPVVKGSTEAAASQTEINRANYCLLQMCTEKHIPMIYSSEVFFDEEGYGDEQRFQPDGFHFQGDNFPVYTEYVRDEVKLP